MNTSKNRTTVEFRFLGDAWVLVDAWAEENGFRLVAHGEFNRLYRKGFSTVMAPGLVEITLAEGGTVRIQAWVKADPYLFLAVLSGKSPEMAVASRGLTAAIPRRRTRDAVNRLLKAFSQPSIP